MDPVGESDKKSHYQPSLDSWLAWKPATIALEITPSLSLCLSLSGLFLLSVCVPVCVRARSSVYFCMYVRACVRVLVCAKDVLPDSFLPDSAAV